MSDLTNNNKNVRDDEIDLLDLIRRIGRTLSRWGNALGRAFLITVVFLLRRWLPLGLSIAAGIGVSYFLKNTSASFYTSDLVLRNNLVIADKLKTRDNYAATSELISKINKLHTFCSEANLTGLSAALSMKPEPVKNISDISPYWVIDQSKDGIPDYVDYRGNHNVYDTTNIRMHDRLSIRVRINAPQDLSLVRDGIIKFVENDSLYQQRNRLRLRQNEELLARYDYDIRQLDSLQKVKYFEETRNIRPANSGQIVFIQEQKTQLLTSDIYDLYEKKQLLETENNLYKGVVTVISDFSSPTRRDNGVMYYGKKMIPYFFFITLFVLIILANRRSLLEIFKKY